MIRLLISSLALLSLNSAAYSDTPPSPATDSHAMLFNQAHPNSPLLRSMIFRGAAHSTPVALSCCTVCSAGKACGKT